MLGRSRPTISFEFMAPRDESEVDVLEQTVATLAGHAPDWVSVTYRVRTGDKILNWMEREGVANVLALRGDPPVTGQPFAPVDPQLTHGSDLVSLVRKSGYRFGIGAACSAEKHPESPDVEHELRYMKLKVESGADFLITQLFFDNRFYFDLVRRARNAGVTVPIVPGLMPVPSRRSLGVMASMSGATVPAALQHAIDEASDDEAIRALGVQHCIAQCVELLEARVPGLHFYTFNRARAPIEILAALRGAQLLAS